MNKNNSESNPIESILRKQLVEKGIRKLVVGVSGGADSMALLHSLHKIGMELLAVHCNFHLRGRESERDMNHVVGFCKSAGINCEVKNFDVEAYRAKFGGSIEMACRNLRYEEFKRIKTEIHADRIAVAHNADDQAETVLLNLMRGAGVAGMRGMLSDNGTILRPFLNVKRTKIEEYLMAEGVDYITDSTNLSSDYQRNFLRNEIIPLLRSRWPNATESICRTAKNMAREEIILRNVENSYVANESDSLYYSIIRQSVDSGWILRRFAKRFGATNRQIEEMTEGFNRTPIQSGKLWMVRGGKIVMERDRFQFVPIKKGLTIKINANCFDVQEITIEKVRHTDLNELWTSLAPEQIEFRPAREGDRISPLGMQGSALVSKIMKDNKLSLSQKENVIVAAERSSGEIIWIKGLKRSRFYLIETDRQVAYRYQAEWE